MSKKLFCAKRVTKLGALVVLEHLMKNAVFNLKVGGNEKNGGSGRSQTVKVGNFDHLMTFKIVLKIFPNSF